VFPWEVSVFQNRLRTLQLVGYAEATSFLVLLGVAMPLKYAAGWPLGVTVVGMAHGVLWILYLIAAARAGLAHKWGAKEFLGAGLASVLPAGPFVFDAWVIRRTAEKELTTEDTENTEEKQRQESGGII
jgi:integral membrane protein